MAEFDQTPEAFPPPPPPPVYAATSGLADNVAGLLAYITIIPAILFLVLEPYNKNRFIRFHSFQCIVLSVCGFASSMIMVIPILGWIIGIVMAPVLFVCWILCMYNAYQGKMFKLPILGQIAENLAK